MSSVCGAGQCAVRIRIERTAAATTVAIAGTRAAAAVPAAAAATVVAAATATAEPTGPVVGSVGSACRARCHALGRLIAAGTAVNAAVAGG